MATIRLAGSAILNTVVETATTATRVLQSVGHTAEMLHDYAEFASRKQKLQIRKDWVNFEDTVVSRNALTIIKQRDELRDYIAQHPDRVDEINAILQQLRDA